MSFSVGDPVHVPGIGTGVIREVRRGGRYVVLVKNTVVVVGEAQIAPVEAPRRRSRPASDSGAAGPVETLVPPPPTASSIDLHGRTAIEADSEVVEFLNAALLSGLAEVRIIHGRSGGRVKAAVHARLRQLPSVRAFRVDPSNPGVTIVAL
jgi:DNA mismatch repair protein MutS2